jgi:hypothetical protein
VRVNPITQHPGATAYIFCDTPILEAIEGLRYRPNLRLQMLPMLDKYGAATRPAMEREKTWASFQMEKANVIKYALQREPDTLFVDSDITVLAPFRVPVQQMTADGPKYQIGLSAHMISERRVHAYGYFNGGLLWVADKTVPDAWVKFTQTSRFYDQASLEDLADTYRYACVYSGPVSCTGRGNCMYVRSLSSPSRRHVVM